MAPLICPSPNIIDQAFPRSVEELRLIRLALARLSEGIQAGEFALILTSPLQQYVMDLDITFDWSRIAEFPELQVIYHVLAQMALQQHGVVAVNVSSVKARSLHPLPKACRADGAGQIWSEEAGRLLTVHDEECGGNTAFIGVGCTSAFAGGTLGEYDNPQSLPCFPLVGPNQVSCLADSFQWDVPEGVDRMAISFDTAKNRVSLLGGRVTKPKGSSHYEVKFKGGRTWPLDVNFPEVPEQYLKQLESITGFELAVIKYVLVYGKWPKRKSRIAHIA